jgi:anaerobic selenocysteine-containing dehydrogenase
MGLGLIVRNDSRRVAWTDSVSRLSQRRPNHLSGDEMPETRIGICKVCFGYCPIEVTVEDGRTTKDVDDRRSPLYGGYICPKGQALPESHRSASWLPYSSATTADTLFRTACSKPARSWADPQQDGATQTGHEEPPIIHHQVPYCDPNCLCSILHAVFEPMTSLSRQRIVRLRRTERTRELS